MIKAEDSLGLIFEAENRSFEAGEAYHLAIEWQKSDIRPSEQPLLNYKRRFFSVNSEASRRSSFSNRLLPSLPKNMKCHEQLARALDKQEQHEKAIEQMQAAIQLDSDNPGLHYQLGLIYRHAGQTEKSRQEMIVSAKLYGSYSSEPDTP
jgi:Flp pilus assembly protein TadD